MAAVVRESVCAPVIHAGLSALDAEPGLQRRPMVDEFDQRGASLEGDFPESGPTGPVELPPAELGNLPEIAQVWHPVPRMSCRGGAHPSCACGMFTYDFASTPCKVVPLCNLHPTQKSGIGRDLTYCGSFEPA